MSPPFEVRAAGVEAWHRAAASCEAATFFHVPAWFDAFAAITPDSGVVVKRFVFPDGREAIFPLLERRWWRGLRRSHASSPAGCFGGWLAPEPLDADQARAVAHWMLRRHRRLVWRINPYEPQREVLDALATRCDSTEVLPLDAFADEEALERHYRHSVRKQIRKAERAKLEVTQAVAWPDWERYYALYERALRRWGSRATSRHPIALFRKLYELQSDDVRLWLVGSEGTPIGGNLNFYHGGHCVEWHAAYDERFFAVGSRNCLVHHVIQDAWRRGFRVYDFNPSGGNAGTQRFKQSYGTTTIPSNVIATEGGR